MTIDPAENRSLDEILKIDHVDDVLVITPSGDLGEYIVTAIEADARAALQSFQKTNGCRHVVIDFCNTDYFGSSALGLFVRLWKCVRERGGNMAMCNLSVHEIEVLKVTRLNEFWQICESLPRAIAAVK